MKYKKFHHLEKKKNEILLLWVVEGGPADRTPSKK